VNSAPIVVCSNDDGESAVEKASAPGVMGAVLALCEFSLLVTQHNQMDQSFKALDDAANRLGQKKGNF
jgi:hypothetical protein